MAGCRLNSERSVIFSILIVLFLHHLECECTGPTDVLYNLPHLEINTTSGRFAGVATHLSTPDPVDAWLGIPYAKKPINELRFKAPVTLIDEDRVTNYSLQNAWEFGDACPQAPSHIIPVPISEDCLSLNIYRPAKPSKPFRNGDKAQDELLSVLVWIHGGGYTYGASSEYDGTTIVSQSHEMGKPIVFVTLNYRQNVFGFLTSDTLPVEDLSAGLQDQLAALKWLQVNIAAFGGDPKKITIWGQSAGGSAIGLHMVYLPQSQNLFRAAIIDSGGATSHAVPPVEVYDLPEFPYEILLRFTGCTNSTDNPINPLECLRSLPMQVLTDAGRKLSQYGRLPGLVVWGPSWKSDSWINERPSKRLQSGNFINIPVLMGTNKDEGTGTAMGAVKGWRAQALQHDLLLTDMSNPSSIQKNPIITLKADETTPGNESDDLMLEFMSNSSVFDLRTVNSSVYKKMLDLYPDKPELGAPFDTGNETFGISSTFKRLAAWFTDLHYAAPTRLMAAYTSPRQNTYVYLFSGPRNTSEPHYQGVHHSAEFALIFNSGWYQELPDDEKAATFRLARKMRTHYINFVTDLNPGSDWPLYNLDSKLVMKLDKYNSTVVEENWRVEQMSFMNSQPAFDTFSL